jgi:hypothetical protein
MFFIYGPGPDCDRDMSACVIWRATCNQDPTCVCMLRHPSTVLPAFSRLPRLFCCKITTGLPDLAFYIMGAGCLTPRKGEIAQPSGLRDCGAAGTKGLASRPSGRAFFFFFWHKKCHGAKGQNGQERERKAELEQHVESFPRNAPRARAPSTTCYRARLDAAEE